MASLGSKKIGSNYQKLLQKDESGMVADGAGNVITLNTSGSEYYISGSAGESQYDVLKAITVTGSIIPEGSGSWDLGSEYNPFRDLYVTEESIKFVHYNPISGKREITKWTKADTEDTLSGIVKKKINPITKKRLPIAIATTIQTIITEPFEFNSDRDLYPVDVTASDTVQDTYWANDDNNLYLKPTRFGTIGMNTDDLEIV